MPWFAAHAVMYFKRKEGPQEHFSVWENVLLVEARDGEDAMAKAEARAREDEGDSSGSLVWGGHPARLVFAGIRKLLTVAHEAAGDVIGHGDEVTYSEFEVADEAAVRALAAGEEVSLKYVE
jgi:hypothetical protein